MRSHRSTSVNCFNLRTDSKSGKPVTELRFWLYLKKIVVFTFGFNNADLDLFNQSQHVEHNHIIKIIKLVCGYNINVKKWSFALI